MYRPGGQLEAEYWQCYLHEVEFSGPGARPFVFAARRKCKPDISRILNGYM